MGGAKLINPEKIERAALAEPWRAQLERSVSLNFRAKCELSAVINAANPEADEANPAPVGKLLLVSILMALMG